MQLNVPPDLEALINKRLSSGAGGPPLGSTTKRGCPILSRFCERVGNDDAARGAFSCSCLQNPCKILGTGPLEQRTLMSALTEALIAVLNRLTVRPDAARRWAFFFPVGNILWEDEMPDSRDKWGMSAIERKTVNRLFEIRRQIWHGAELSAEEAAFWEAARSEAPDWALFQRLSLSDDDREYLKQVEEEAEKAFEMMCAEADKVEVRDKGDGVEEFSLTFDLTKDEDRWKDE